MGPAELCMVPVDGPHQREYSTRTEHCVVATFLSMLSKIQDICDRTSTPNIPVVAGTLQGTCILKEKKCLQLCRAYAVSHAWHCVILCDSALHCGISCNYHVAFCVVVRISVFYRVSVEASGGEGGHSLFYAKLQPYKLYIFSLAILKFEFCTVLCCPVYSRLL